MAQNERCSKRLKRTGTTKGVQLCTRQILKLRNKREELKRCSLLAQLPVSMLAEAETASGIDTSTCDNVEVLWKEMLSLIHI